MIKKQFAIITTTFAFVIMLTAFSWVNAAPATIEEIEDLPPRPTEAATETPSTTQQTGFSGGLIQLSAPVTQTAPADYWAVVEWKDMEGSWNTVEGWQGEFDQDGYVTWWVAPDNLGEDNFRWVVYTNMNMEDAVFTSETFSLPDSNGQTLTISPDLD